MDETTKDADWVATRHGGMRRQSAATTGSSLVERHSDEVKEGSARETVSSQSVAELGETGDGSAGPNSSRTEESPGTGFDSLPVDHDARARAQRKWALALNEPLGLPECPYVIRWRVETPLFSIRLHHWLSHDDPRYRHDHSWSFVTFVLKGGYTDVSERASRRARCTNEQSQDPDDPGFDLRCPGTLHFKHSDPEAPCDTCGARCGSQVADYVEDWEEHEHLKAPAVRYRPATHRHTVYPDPGGCWTVIFTGPIVRQYGFWIGDKFRRASKYFYKYGHHPCD